MRLNYRADTVCLGNVEIGRLSRVTELDSGLVTGPSTYEPSHDGSTTVCHSYESLQMIEQQLAIIVPCMNEELTILQGVLRGIPHHCLIIVVSNSDPSNFGAERAMAGAFCTHTHRQLMIVHQKDSGLASLFPTAGMPHIIDHSSCVKPQGCTGCIQNGKGEAMMIGTVLAKSNGRRFVGFIDADNLVPGAVHEYCKVFATGLYHALNAPSVAPHSNAEAIDDTPLAMVRIKWKSKPKIVDGKLVPQESGRCSRIVNAWMNRFFSSCTGRNDVANLIMTANAGEHAMSTDLALKLNFATGYAVEPYQLIDMLERSGADALLHTPPVSPGDAKSQSPSASTVPLGRMVKIMQIETLNPHIHDFSKGEEHITRMQAQGLSAIFHSKLIPKQLKEELREYMKDKLQMSVDEDGTPKQARVYPPMDAMDFKAFESLR